MPDIWAPASHLLMPLYVRVQFANMDSEMEADKNKLFSALRYKEISLNFNFCACWTQAKYVVTSKLYTV